MQRTHRGLTRALGRYGPIAYPGIGHTWGRFCIVPEYSLGSLLGLRLQSDNYSGMPLAGRQGSIGQGGLQMGFCFGLQGFRASVRASNHADGRPGGRTDMQTAGSAVGSNPWMSSDSAIPESLGREM